MLTSGLTLQEFIRVGYYVSTEYWDEELREMETPPNPPLIDRCVGSYSALAWSQRTAVGTNQWVMLALNIVMYADCAAIS